MDGALEIAGCSMKAKAVGLTRWLARKSVDNLQDEVQEARQSNDGREQTIVERDKLD